MKRIHYSGPTGIPVIYLTGITGPDAEFKGFKAGAVDYITKRTGRRRVRRRIPIPGIIPEEIPPASGSIRGSGQKHLV